MALERLSETRAINNALAMAFAKEGAGLPPQLQKDQRDAYVAE